MRNSARFQEGFASLTPQMAGVSEDWRPVGAAPEDRCQVWRLAVQMLGALLAGYFKLECNFAPALLQLSEVLRMGL